MFETGTVTIPVMVELARKPRTEEERRRICVRIENAVLSALAGELLPGAGAIVPEVLDGVHVATQVRPE